LDDGEEREAVGDLGADLGVEDGDGGDGGECRLWGGERGRGMRVGTYFFESADGLGFVFVWGDGCD
jgi:hypothetical protein